MSVEPFPTPEQVALRIQRVVALNKLCASLMEAGLALYQKPTEPLTARPPGDTPGESDKKR
jgi:hypothetical protein